MRSSSAKTLVLAAFVSCALLAAGCGGGHKASGSPETASPGLRGLLPTPLPQRPDFTLRDTSGKSFNFAAHARGKLTYLYFGYTHCPNACPATMAEITYALHQQPAAVRRQIEVVFVTVDPHRDTPGVLRAWLNHYSRSFVGLTGTEAQIVAAERLAGVPVVPGSYTKHSSFVLPYSPDGQAHVVYTQGFEPADYAHDLPLLLQY